MEEIQKLKADAFDCMMEVEKAKAYQQQLIQKVNEINAQIAELEKKEKPQIKKGK